ncbi:MAG TPA: hypothetical protein V6C96_03045 [Vampirovibrionales bacterium]
MPRYIAKFSDGSQEEYGAPGMDTEKIRNTVTQTLEKKTGKKVTSLQRVKVQGKKTVSKNKKQVAIKKASNKKASSQTTKKSQAKSKSTPKSKIAVKSKTPSRSIAQASPQALQTQINSLENSLSLIVGELVEQIEDLKDAVLVSRRNQLLAELDQIDSQLD